VVHGFTEGVVQLEAYAAFGELILFVEGDLRGDVAAFGGMQQVDAEGCAARLARHVGGPLDLVQPAVVARHQSVFAHFFDVVLLRDDLRFGAGEDLGAVDVVAMEVGVDDVADGQRGDLAEIAEGGLRGGLAFGGVYNHDAAAGEDEDDVA